MKQSTRRWAPVHRKVSSAECRYCGRSGNDHPPVACMLCGTVQCNSRPTCAVCLVGYLPGWPRKDNRPGHVSDTITAQTLRKTRQLAALYSYRYCGYAGCDNEAVARAPRVRAVCLTHAERAKAQGTGIALNVRAGKPVRTIAEHAEEVRERLANVERVKHLRWRGDEWVLVDA